MLMWHVLAPADEQRRIEKGKKQHSLEKPTTRRRALGAPEDRRILFRRSCLRSLTSFWTRWVSPTEPRTCTLGGGEAVLSVSVR